MHSHIKYIDGLKGISAIWITLLHYILAFIPIGYIGWSCGINESDRASIYFSNLPISIFTNSSFPLYTFFALISFISALIFFRNHDRKFIVKQAVKRYFRLLIPILACTLICYMLMACGVMFNSELGKIAPSHWSSVFYQDGYSLTGALKSAFYTTFIYGDGYYCSILWCMNIIFIGSYLTYPILALFGKSKFRWIIYLITFFACIKIRADYTAFVMGIAAADIANKLQHHSMPNKLSFTLFISGLLVGNIIPPISLPNWLQISVLYSIGNFLILIGVSQCIAMKNFLEKNALCKIGRYSFPLILVHFPIMMSLSAWIFVELRQADFAFTPSLLISWIASVPILMIAVVLFYRFVELPSEKLANFIYEKFFLK